MMMSRACGYGAWGWCASCPRHPTRTPPPNAPSVRRRACTIQLHDPLRQVSRLHARVVRDGTGWRLHDLGSKNGLRIDGVRRAEAVLQPGVEIGIGGLTLIAESRLLTALRGFLTRLVGWSAEWNESVDHALRSVRMAVTGRAPLVLCGPGDLVPIARAIHRRALGEDRPFVVCDPRRQTMTRRFDPPGRMRPVRTRSPPRPVARCVFAAGGYHAISIRSSPPCAIPAR